MAGVVAEHLQRMAGDAAFVVKWEDPAPGSQPNG
jgi:hypothetical protein